MFIEHFRAHPCGGAPESGASVSVVVEGKTVVDLWDGWANAEQTRAWERNTIANVFSSGKGITALAIHLLAEDGLLDYDAPVATYWPEFAANGKSDVTVAHVLSHQAGLPSLPDDLGPGGAWNAERVTRALAAAKPMWEPGTGHSYHSVTFGHLLDELARRVCGERLAAVIRKRIAAPLGVDFCVGLTDEEIARCADMIPNPGGPADAAVAKQLEGIELPTDFTGLSNFDQIGMIAFGGGPNTQEWRGSSDFLSAGGHSNARSLARIYGALARGGEIGGVRLLSMETLDRATRLEADGLDLLKGQPWKWALGFMLAHSGPGSARFSGNGFGHGGAYGSLGWAEPKTQMGFGYVANQEWQIAGDPRSSRLLHTALGCL